MGQLLVRQLDDVKLDRLKRRARELKVSTEALAREAIYKAAELTVEEKLAIVRRMQARSAAARVPGIAQTLGVDLIREDRDHGH